MNRRSFMQMFAGMAAAIGLIAPLATEAKLVHDIGPRKIGWWAIDADGTMSLHGQSVFQIYRANGGLSTESVSYRWDGHKVHATHRDHLGNILDIGTVNWTVNERGPFNE